MSAIRNAQSAIRNPLNFVATSATSPRFIYWVHWGKTLGKFTSTQLVVQAVGVATGILLVRTLDQREYAYFTIVFAILATMNILADSGISIGLSSIGGRVWQDRYRFGQLINTALRLRLYLAAAAVVIVTPILVWMLWRNGASLGYVALLSLLVLAALGFQLTTGVLMVVPRLHSQIGRVQKIDLAGAVARLALVCAACFVFLNAVVAALATVVSMGLQYLLLKRWTTESFDARAPVSAEDLGEMRGIIKSQAPNAIFYCLQGQVTVWLITVFGSTQSIAEVGALGRLGVAFAVIGAVMTSIVLPSFARCQATDKLRRRYFQIVGCFIGFGAMLLSVAVMFPNELLWVLGRQYGHLTDEVGLVVLLAAVNSVGIAMVSLNMTKGWVKYYWLNIPCLILLQAFLIYRLDLTTTHGVLVLGVLSLLPGIVVSAAITWSNLFRPVLAARQD